ncbi:MAG TPA: ABC transporter permease [Ruminococcus flavefaciens]|nr:ABC transporter permease [Ruminococcus flavefaciens]HQM00683.1 ABC transporter permease [Ruminococcus flavefaciens]
MLFFKECKKIARSLSFWIYCIILALMFFTNYYSDSKYYEGPPSTYEQDYGTKAVEDPELIMDGAINALMGEFASNRYICYPVGFYKAVSLDESDREMVEKYIQELTGTNHEGIAEFMDEAQINYVEHGLSTYPEYVFNTMIVDKNVSYDRFVEIMGAIDDILGGGSFYAVDSLANNFALVPMTYEEALKEYEDSITEDTMTGALSRLFCDYTGIDLALIPVFVAAAFTAADRRRRMTELVYSRKISSLRLTFTRYAALVTTMFIPVLITMIIAAVQASVVYSGEELKMHFMFTTPVFWLLPEIMVVTAVGMLLTEIFSAGIAIAVQGVWAFLSLMSGSNNLYGDITKFGLMCRHNTLYHRSAFMETYNDFVFNRIFYMLLALVLVCAAAYVYNLKRGGRFNGIRLFGEGGILRRKA